MDIDPQSLKPAQEVTWSHRTIIVIPSLKKFKSRLEEVERLKRHFEQTLPFK